MNKYRNKFEIVADILRIVKDGAHKTEIMYKGNLSYSMLTRYLSKLLTAGLVSIASESNSYKITDKGKLFLERFNRYIRRCRSLERQLEKIKREEDLLEKMCKKVCDRDFSQN